jgi:P4 family phage/plasmid primase-like protien
LDSDKPEADELIISNLPKTLKVRTARGRSHYYYRCPNGKNLKVFLNDKKDTLADVQFTNKFLVAPGSTFEKGIYEIEDDMPIAEISFQQILDCFKDYLVFSHNQDRDREFKKSINTMETDLVCKEIKQKINIRNYLKSRNFETFGNPGRCPFGHDSSSKKNFSYTDWTYHCFHCDESGSIFNLVMKLEDCDFMEAKSILAKLTDTSFDNTPNVFQEFQEYLAEYFTRESNFLMISRDFAKIHPFYYDNNKIWWVWDQNKYCWRMCDETDILIAIDKLTRMPNTNSTIKNEMLEALRRTGRQNKPKAPTQSWVQFKDKIVDGRTGEIFKASPEWFMCNPIPYAIGDSEDTPTMDKLLKEWVVREGVQDESYVKTLYEILAYAGLQHQFMQRLFAFTGTGMNGKGTFFKLINKFYGDENICTTEFKTLSKERFETSALYKKQICFIGEIDAYDVNNTNLLKKMTGEDDIRYEIKGKTPFKDKSGTTIFVATNALPLTPDQSPGYYRRWLIVDFPNVFSIKNDLIEEIPEIEFNNLARKCVRILKELYKTNQFTNEGTIEERAIRYTERSNPIMLFIEQECIEDAEEHIILQDFCKKFNEYLKDNRLRVMTVRAISNRLKAEGFQVKGRHVLQHGKDINTTCVFGLRFKHNLDDFDTKNTKKEVKMGKKDTFGSNLDDFGSDENDEKIGKEVNLTSNDDEQPLKPLKATHSDSRFTYSKRVENTVVSNGFNGRNERNESKDYIDLGYIEGDENATP